jgi:zinc finger domain, LSD1 subclass subfamily
MEQETQVINDAIQTKCPSCGGMMEFSPKSHKLQCLYCGKTKDLDLTPVEVQENDFEEWVAKSDDNLNEETDTESAQIKCHQCGATTTLPPAKSSAKCAFCGTPLILQEAQIKRFWKPNYMLPFQIGKDECNSNFQKWIKGKWYAVSALKKGNVQTENFKGIYIPFWTYDAETTTEYSGSRGDNRTVKEKDDDGNWVTTTITDWSPASGTVSRSFDDVIVPASTNVPFARANSKNEKWDLENVVPYNPEFLAGFMTEIYNIDFREAIDSAKEKMECEIKYDIEQDIGGDKQEIDYSHTEYSDIMFKLLMLPLWIGAFQYNGKTFNIFVNGRTGEVLGDYPINKFKVVITIIFGIILGCLLIYLTTLKD